VDVTYISSNVSPNVSTVDCSSMKTDSVAAVTTVGSTFPGPNDTALSLAGRPEEDETEEEEEGEEDEEDKEDADDEEANTP
jgi:hypothetical protein